MQNGTNEHAGETPKRRPGAPKGNRNAWKTGLYTAEMKDLRRRLRARKRRAKAVRARVERELNEREQRVRGNSCEAGIAGAAGEGGEPKPAQN